MIKTIIKYKPLYKKFLRLKVNPLANNKFLKIKKVLKIERYNNKKTDFEKFITKPEYFQIEKFKNKKWATFLEFLKKSDKFYRKFKPYKLYLYSISKQASQGNSLRKRYKNELLTRKLFNYAYGGFRSKFLNRRITRIYNSKIFGNPKRITIKFFESRLDSVLYKSKFSYSVKNARQLIAHKHVKVNNRIETNKSCILKQGDLIEINSRSIKIVKENLKKTLKERPDSILWPIPPNYLNINYKTLEIIFGDIKSFDFSTAFTFKINIDLFITSYYRY